MRVTPWPCAQPDAPPLPLSQNAPVDVGFMVSKLLLTIQLCPKTEFQCSEKFGEDLSASTWEHILAIDLLCCHQKWVWTHDNIIRYGVHSRWRPDNQHWVVAIHSNPLLMTIGRSRGLSLLSHPIYTLLRQDSGMNVGLQPRHTDAHRGRAQSMEHPQLPCTSPHRSPLVSGVSRVTSMESELTSGIFCWRGLGYTQQC